MTQISYALLEEVYDALLEGDIKSALNIFETRIYTHAQYQHDSEVKPIYDDLKESPAKLSSIISNLKDLIKERKACALRHTNHSLNLTDFREHSQEKCSR